MYIAGKIFLASLIGKRGSEKNLLCLKFVKYETDFLISDKYLEFQRWQMSGGLVDMNNS